jgi:hypothetical protein
MFIASVSVESQVGFRRHPDYAERNVVGTSLDLLIAIHNVGGPSEALIRAQGGLSPDLWGDFPKGKNALPLDSQ